MSQQLKQKSWSYSQLSAYEQCAHAHMYRRIVKLPEPPSYHLQNGTYVHSLAENFLLGKTKELPKELSKFTKEFNNLLEAKAIPEEAIVLRKDWSHIGGEEAWMSDEAWLRLKLDARIENYLVDFKTGKVYDEHVKQGRLYANVHMLMHQDVAEVDVEFWYLNSGQVVSHVFYRDDLEKDVAEWERRVEIMHNDASFIPTPHQYCRNCYVKHLCTAQSA